jgi:hypothetical protein
VSILDQLKSFTSDTSPDAIVEALNEFPTTWIKFSDLTQAQVEKLIKDHVQIQIRSIASPHYQIGNYVYSWSYDLARNMTTYEFILSKYYKPEPVPAPEPVYERNTVTVHNVAWENGSSSSRRYRIYNNRNNENEPWRTNIASSRR